jgi:hypothetical protein
MFRSATDHHQGVHVFPFKITELKFEYSYVVMWQHNVFCLYVMSGVVRSEDCTPHHTRHHIYTLYIMLPHHHITTYEYSHFNSVILTRNT